MSIHDRHYGLNLAAGFMILIGWGGLVYLVQNVLPTPGPRWMFFVLLYIAAVGTSLPFIRFLNIRFTNPNVPETVILREGLWVGLFVTTCAWLQIPRVLNWSIALLLALAVVVIEGFLRLREVYDEPE
ncbi:MAG: hypothetical protein H6673_07655 [Anaerolineales bacterium]|nr:hypothetical protein [Anaerolineales bacterium]